MIVKLSFEILSFEKQQDADGLKVGVADLINQWVRGSEHGSRCSSPFTPAVSPSFNVETCIHHGFSFLLNSASLELFLITHFVLLLPQFELVSFPLLPAPTPPAPLHLV